MKNLVLLCLLAVVSFLAPEALAQKAGDKTVCFTSSMDCKNCEISIFEHLRFEKGVKDLKIDHVSNTIRVVYADKRTSEDALKKSVEKKGYKAEKITEDQYLKLIEKAKEHTGTPAAPHHH